MELCPQRLREFLTSHPHTGTCWIAFSGGMDSTVLLHLAARLNPEGDQSRFNIKALHVHHGLNAKADAWADHCRHTARALGLFCHVSHVDATPAPGESLEEAARHARYLAIRNQIGAGDCVLVAHHQDDQAETFLLQLFRGAGIAGLASMPVAAPLGCGILLRPLLDTPRSEMVAYATKNGLDWIEDPSNQNTAIERNFLRHTILPTLREHWPAVSVAVARSAGHSAEALGMLQNHVAALFKTVHHADDNTLRIDSLRNLARPEQKEVIRYWFRHSGQRMPSTAMLDRILTECIQARPDRNPRLQWPGGELRRYRESLYLLHQPLEFSPPEGEILWEPGDDRMELPAGNGCLVARKTDTKAGIPAEVWRSSRITISYRRGGEKIRLPGRTGTHELRKLYQESGIPPWIRHRLPLIYLDGQLACVGGRWLAAQWVHDSNTANCITIDWEPPSSMEPFAAMEARRTDSQSPCENQAGLQESGY